MYCQEHIPQLLRHLSMGGQTIKGEEFFDFHITDLFLVYVFVQGLVLFGGKTILGGMIVLAGTAPWEWQWWCRTRSAEEAIGQCVLTWMVGRGDTSTDWTWSQGEREWEDSDGASRWQILARGSGTRWKGSLTQHLGGIFSNNIQGSQPHRLPALALYQCICQ